MVSYFFASPKEGIGSMLMANDKVVVVTGASSGLGRSLAIEAGRRGAKVALLARRESILKKLKDVILCEGGEPIALPTTVGNPDSVGDAFVEIDSTWGRIDILFNCAGVLEPVCPLIEASDDDLLASLKTNVFGIYLTTRESLKRMVTQERGGTIITITSGAGLNPYAGWSACGSQKAAVNIFTRCVALEVTDKPIRVVAISPGPFESPMQEIIRKTDVKAFPSREKFVRLHKEGKLASPEAIAKILLDLSLTDWPELSGMVEDLRSPDFQKQCMQHGIEVNL